MFSLIFFLTVGLLQHLILPTQIFAHWDSAYFRNSNDGFSQRLDWMSSIRDDVRISELALPGTHDSAAFGEFVENVVTQCLNFDQQLEFGIRVFDIRVRHINNSFTLHHGFVYLESSIEDFLESVDKFLLDNPSETVLFRLKQEYSGSNDNNSQNLRVTLNDKLSTYKLSTYLKTTENNIKLGKARGKFIILSDHDIFNHHGLLYPTFNIQDNFELRNNFDLYSKWKSVKSHLMNASTGSANTFYVNYLSGSIGSLPYFIASGHSFSGTSASRLLTGKTTPDWTDSYPDFPRVNCFIGNCMIAFEGTNILTRDFIQNINGQPSARSVGIIMADFPGDSLIQTVIENNCHLLKF